MVESTAHHRGIRWKNVPKKCATIIEEENNNNIASDVHHALTYYLWDNSDNEDHDYKIINHSSGKKKSLRLPQNVFFS